MRVIAGEAKGRPLTAPRGTATRPTSDAVREAIFNTLGAVCDLEDAAVLDLFAGTGALGIEALSRGAGHATFIENDRPALVALRANLERTGFTDRATVIAADVGRTSLPPADVAFADPPYAFSGWPTLLGRLDAGLLVVERDQPQDPGAEADWRVLKVKHYGSTVVTLLVPGTEP